MYKALAGNTVGQEQLIVYVSIISDYQSMSMTMGSA